MKKRLILLLPILYIFLQVNAQDSIIVSDMSWKSSGNLYSGWNNVNFNDSYWSNVIHPIVPWSPQFDEPTHTYSGKVILIWDQVSNPAYMRKTFFLNNLNIDSAIVWGTVDDDMDYYVNGNLIFTKSNCAPHIFKSSIKNHLQIGENVLAVKGINCFVYQWFCSELILYKNAGDTNVIQNVYYNIFPVPCTGILNFQGFRPYSLIIMTDAIGKQVLKQHLISNKIDISTLSPGLYEVTVNDNGIITTKKIVKY